MFLGFLPPLTDKKNGNFSEKGDEILGHDPISVPGTSFPLPSYFFLSMPHKSEVPSTGGVITLAVMSEHLW